ncbi:SLC2A13 [Acanthosepion pharaonis]|uniref:SLC2A13 n=1 Tax=Acanthosepion pharaonis TaxID=158019 RepID=A0A812EDZ1_ACAPH|nr:SLC2A13 [Sepia pharaonis]
MTCGQLCDKIGRRYMVILSTVIAIIASSIETSGLYHNLPGRILAGMSIGLSCLSIPIYLAENTVVSIRGPIIMLNMAALTLGQLLSGIAAASFFYLKNKGWRFLSGIIILPSSLQLVAFFFLPESTCFLAKKGQLAKAQKVMNLLWKELPEKEFELMISDQNENKEYKQKSSFQIFMCILQTPPVRRALLLGCSLHIINQMSGINIIIFYSGMVVKMAGVYDDTVTIWLSTIPTLINFLGTFVGFYLVERIGRRLLLLTSTAGVIVSLIMVSLAFWQIEVQSPVVSFVEPNANFTPCGMYRTCAKCVLDPLCGFCYQEHPILGPVNGSCLPALKMTNSYSKLGRCNSTFLGDHSPFHLKWQSDFCPSNFAYFIMAGQILYLLFFASGLGSLPWTICSEIYPMWARGISNSISSSIMWLFSWLMTGTFLTLIQCLTTYGTFLLMACVTLIGWVFWFLCLPETKGKSLEEAELLFTKPFFKKIKLKTEKNEEPVFI